jgi:ABC-type glycerol-3-phosphate transport system permease component
MTVPAAPHHRRLTPSAGRKARYATLIVSSALMVAPLLWALSTSLKHPQDVFAPGSGLIPSSISWKAYRDVFTLLPFDQYLWHSIVVTVTVVLPNVVFDLCAAYAFAKLKFPGRDLLFFLLMITLTIPMQVNLIPLYRMMVWAHGLVPAVGVDTLPGIIAPSAVQVFGIFLMRQFFTALPDSLIEAARLDGAGELRILFTVVLPIALPGLATVTIFTLLSSWNDFLWPMIVSSSTQSRTLPVGLALLSRRNSVNWPDTMAGTVVTALPMIAIFLVLQRRFIEGLTAGSVKDVA